MSGVNNGKFVIDFRSSQVRHVLLCIHLTVMKNALINTYYTALNFCNHSIGLIIGYSTSLTQYLTYSTSYHCIPLIYFTLTFFSLIEMFINVYG